MCFRHDTALGATAGARASARNHGGQKQSCFLGGQHRSPREERNQQMDTSEGLKEMGLEADISVFH